MNTILFQPMHKLIQNIESYFELYDDKKNTEHEISYDEFHTKEKIEEVHISNWGWDTKTLTLMAHVKPMEIRLGNDNLYVITLDDHPAFSLPPFVVGINSEHNLQEIIKIKLKTIFNIHNQTENYNHFIDSITITNKSLTETELKTTNYGFYNENSLEIVQSVALQKHIETYKCYHADCYYDKIQNAYHVTTVNLSDNSVKTRIFYTPENPTSEMFNLLDVEDLLLFTEGSQAFVPVPESVKKYYQFSGGMADYLLNGRRAADFVSLDHQIHHIFISDGPIFTNITKQKGPENYRLNPIRDAW